MCVTDDHKIDSFYAFIHAAHFHNPYFFVRKDARRMRSLNVSTAVRDIYWLIQGVTFCAVYIYAPSLSLNLQLIKAPNSRSSVFPLDEVDAAAPQTSRQSESIHLEPATVSKCARCESTFIHVFFVSDAVAWQHH